MSFLPPIRTQLQQLLDEIKFQQQKELQQAALQGDIANFISRGTTYWTDVFVRHFLFQTDRSIDADDLLFFIRKRHIRGTALTKFQTDVEVFRKDSKKLPIGDPEIEWQETVFLNLLIHQLEYTLTLAICTRTSPKDLQVLKRHSQKVYASPSRRRMDTKGDLEEITYPYLSFMVDNFDEVYSDMPVKDGEMIVVELIAADRDHGFQAVLFLGSIRYDALKGVYDARASLGSKMAQKMTFGFFSGSHNQRVEYVRLKGPHGKGHAEVAVSKPKGAGVETPTSEPGFCMTDGIWDSDAESDTEDFVFKHHRRLSDPSSTLNNYTKSAWRSMKGGDSKKARSQNEGLDYCGLAEIEAGDVRDDRRSGAVWCCGCCGCECMSLTDRPTVEPEPLPINYEDYDTCYPSNSQPRTAERCLHSCCCVPYPALPRSQSLAMDNIPLSPIYKHPPSHTQGHGGSSVSSRPGPSATQTLGRSKKANPPRPPLVPSKTVVVPPSNYPLSSTLEKSSSMACLQDAKLICRDRLLRILPNKLTSTGVRVFYLCDARAENNKTGIHTTEFLTGRLSILMAELDDGAYNPLWTMRGFTQTLYMMRETRRAQSVPLNAFLTYITLPYSEIMKDIMENREEPVLTF